MIRWLFSSAKETVTPEGVLVPRCWNPRLQSDGQQDREKHLILVCTQLVDGVPDVGDDHHHRCSPSRIARAFA